MVDGLVCEFGTPTQIFENPEKEETKQFLHGY